ncbi:hypothetical protein SY83_02360 [Paenibacillus swuensis]|uniref:Uncharacterized protein n=1 Tax=Paenibacillus swuensis TaxID=1178515 RepID=A0A172TE95_9BACL|nr:hypothetical protein [Paenibacillus swuensis]ANE45361.1 hypothetical protein SY83_02360 [Paenibacillus swuensis]
MDIRYLYNLIEGHVILPSELIANVKLPNYEFVKFSNGYTGLIVETRCALNDGAIVDFTYYFDKQDKLLKLISQNGSLSEVLFDRELEVQKFMRDIKGKVPETV